ncbi:hypothetical protein C8R47DRAFT_1297833 [Mycena vitilis]|nr:hypothetical protein C8R47DRAFT_1297833 [Mycena vitilis]
MMCLGALLFNPTARVYNIRILLVGSVLLTTWSALVWDFFSVGTGCLILVHHPLAYVGVAAQSLGHRTYSQSPRLWAGLSGLGVIDMALIVVEVIRKSHPSRFRASVTYVNLSSCCLLVGRTARRGPLESVGWTIYSTAPGSTDNGGNLPPGYSLRIIGTVLAPKNRFPRRVSGCKATIYAVENPVESLAGKAIGQRLIERRGEFVGIIILRALILSAIVVVIPFFAVYVIVWIPLETQVHTTILSPSLATIGFVPFSQWNASIVFQAAAASDQSFTGIMSPNVTISELYTAESVSCPSANRLVSTSLAGGGYSTQSLTVAEFDNGFRSFRLA